MAAANRHKTALRRTLRASSKQSITLEHIFEKIADICESAKTK